MFLTGDLAGDCFLGEFWRLGPRSGRLAAATAARARKASSSSNFSWISDCNGENNKYFVIYIYGVHVQIEMSIRNGQLTSIYTSQLTQLGSQFHG